MKLRLVDFLPAHPHDDRPAHLESRFLVATAQHPYFQATGVYRELREWLVSVWQSMPASAWAANAILATVFLLIGGLIFNWLPAWVRYQRSRTADFSGEWENILYTPENKVAKRDTLLVFQKGFELYGSITRDEPVQEAHRHFKFLGQLKADRFVATYWAVDQTINRAGSWHVRLVNDGYYSGLYVTVTPDNRIVAKRLDFRRKDSTPPDWLEEYHHRLASELTASGEMKALENTLAPDAPSNVRK